MGQSVADVLASKVAVSGGKPSLVNRTYPPGSGVHVYAVHGRLLLRPVDGSDHLGIERDEITTIEGFPALEPEGFGAAICKLLWSVREVPRPTTWPSISDYAKPLLAATPTRYRSYRQWQRATRSVSIRPRDGSVTVQRYRPDGRGAWLPADSDSDEGWVRNLKLEKGWTPTDLGIAVLKVLEEPSLKELVGG